MQPHYTPNVCQIQALTKQTSSNCSKSKHCEINHSLSMLSNTRPNASGVTALCTWYACATCARMHRRLWRWKIWGGCHNRKYCLYVCSDANSRTCFFFSESMWDVGLLLFFFSLSFFFHKIRKETDGCNNWNPPCSQFFCFWTELLFLSLHVMAGQVHLICTVQDHDCGARREEFYLAGCEYFTVETKNSFVYSERKHGERESSSQNFTQYRKLLAMRKKKVFCFFFLSVDFTVWIVSLNEYVFDISLCQKLSISWFFILFFSPGETVGSASRVLQSPLQFAFQKATEYTVFPRDVQN